MRTRTRLLLSAACLPVYRRPPPAFSMSTGQRYVAYASGRTVKPGPDDVYRIDYRGTSVRYFIHDTRVLPVGPLYG